MSSAEKAVERVVREFYGRLVAFLAARSGDVAGAQDALADALVAALERWPVDGVPRNPEAWLLTVARRKALDRQRHATVIDAAAAPLRAAQEEAEAMMNARADFPDERLKLLFVCAHPAIDVAARTPLMLQVVLGLDAARIASAFLASPAAMTKRLTRAKVKIRDAGITFELPEPNDLGDRIDDVLAAVYASYSLGWDDPASDERRREGLTSEAIWLGRLTAAVLPHEPEAQGLLALMLFCEARRPARRTPEGDYVAIIRQDVGLWSKDALDEADQATRRYEVGDRSKQATR